MPYSVEHLWRDDPGYVVTVEIGRVGGRMGCTGLTIRGAKPRSEVTGTVLRRLKVAELVGEAISELLAQPGLTNAVAAAQIGPGPLLNATDVDEEFVRHRAEFWASAQREAAAIAPLLSSKKKGSTGRRLGVDHYKAVARAYKAAQRSGRLHDPTAAIAELYNVPRSAAANWVHRARMLELLPQSRRGQADPSPRSPRAARRKP